MEQFDIFRITPEGQVFLGIGPWPGDASGNIPQEALDLAERLAKIKDRQYCIRKRTIQVIDEIVWESSGGN